ncbi:MAG: hypothetical protein IKZ53_02350 [Selenomonadaceae bacterium]|nr:hypothetical protein [Selenomonadaceae bacterium]
MRKKILASAAILALLMNSPQVKAEDDIVVFGGEFEDSETKSEKVEEPEPPAELPPEEKPQPVQIEPQEDLPPIQPLEEEEPVQIESQEDLPPIQPLENEQPVQIEPQEDLPPVQPLENEQPAQIQPVNEDDDNLGNTLIFDDLNSLPEQKKLEQPTEEESVDEPFQPMKSETPFEQPTQISDEWQERVEEPVAVVPPPLPVVTVEEKIDEPEEQPARPVRRPIMPRSNVPQQELKMLKPRFIKLAVDDTYTYYLDKEAVDWKKMPYSSSEYMADVWIRMIERKPAELDEDMAAYGAENFKAQIELAREQGYQYQPEDIKVLSQQAYVLEHYYLRPKTRQVQFLCELEVFGRPQNTINERAYDYKNWENLVPGSVESTIYEAAIKVLGKSKASERGHMTFIDMLEEYGRISLR